MAADVLQTPKYGGLRHSSTPRESTAKTNGPFRATQIWHEIIANLKLNVEVKKRRGIMKTYEHCFTGTDAVDVVLHHLLTDKPNFTNKEITREKAVKLCQLMMDNHVFEPVKDTGDSKHPFEDGVNKFYRFFDCKENVLNDLDRPCESCEELSWPEEHMRAKKDLKDIDTESLDGDGVISNPIVLHQHGAVMQEIMELTGTWCRSSDVCLKTPAKLFHRGRISLPSSSSMSNAAYSRMDLSDDNIAPEVEEEMRKEVALSKLLNLLDIPILDNILSYDTTCSTSVGPKPAYSNLGFKNSGSMNSLFSYTDREEDLWWEAALDCIEHLTKGPDMLDISLSEKSDLTQKLRLYSSIADHYRDLPKPLWSDRFMDVQVGILNLLMQNNIEQALMAMHLCMILLPMDDKEELQRLLAFLHQAYSADNVKLSSTESNESLVEKTFTSAVIKNKVLAPHQAGQLLLFMTSNADRLWDVPQDVEDSVRQRLRDKVRGHEEVKMEHTYCTQVSQETYKKQQVEYTEQAIVAMMNGILDNTQFTLKDKKHRLKQLQKHHPTIYWKHFSNMV